MSRKELLQTIQDIENGLAMNPTGEILERLTNRLERAKKNLAALDEKKSESQPLEKSEKPAPQNEMRLPTKAELGAWAKGMQNENPIEPQRRVIAVIENPEPITVPVVQIEFKDRDGNPYIKSLDQVDILTILKTYFKRVATSAKMDAKRYSEAYNSDMGKMVYKLFQGWNLIYNETQEGAAWPPLVDVFPGFGRASLEQKVNAQVLWRWASNGKE